MLCLELGTNFPIYVLKNELDMNFGWNCGTDLGSVFSVVHIQLNPGD